MDPPQVESAFEWNGGDVIRKSGDDVRVTTFARGSAFVRCCDHARVRCCALDRAHVPRHDDVRRFSSADQEEFHVVTLECIDVLHKCSEPKTVPGRGTVFG